MKKRIFTTLSFVLFLTFTMFAQDEMTKEQLESKIAELTAQQAPSKAEVDKYQAEIDALQKQIKNLPGWRTGFTGLVGFDLNGNNNWYALPTPNASSNGLGLGVSAFANNLQDKYFWRNLLNVTIQRTATKVTPSSEPTIALSEGLDLSSLYGYRIHPKFAISAEGKYTTSIIQFDSEAGNYRASINDPGKITVSAGATWTPMDNLVVIIHPLGYELNMPGDFISAPGAKLGATYAATLFKGIAWSSNLSAFIPYTGAGDVQYTTGGGSTATVNYATSDLVNYTWLNGFSMKIFDGISVALNLGLRGDNQIADRGQFALADDPAQVTPKGLALQSFYTLGLAYTL